MSRNLVILGSTGSIGTQTLDVVREMPDRIRVVGLVGGSNTDLLLEQATEFLPRTLGLASGDASVLAGAAEEVFLGEEGMARLVARPEVDLVVVGTSGTAGLMPTLSAIRAGKLVALANKETLVMAGPIIRRELEEGQGELVPIDSEHSAIWQCLQGEPHRSIERLTLTASGGAFRHLAPDELATVTPAQALQHPTWNMGKKITIDSANLMNKGLEAIEARWLFDVPQDHVDILMHPQSIVHSLVAFDDSSTKAQLGLPDMRLPIQYALSHPERWPNALERLDLAAVGELTFGAVDLARYPALALALEAGNAGDTYPAVLCAADEVAVEAFLDSRIRFPDIPRVVRGVLEAHSPCRNPELRDILAADHWARGAASRLLAP